MNYSYDGENELNLIAVGRDVSNITISNNNLFVVCDSESQAPVKVIGIEGGNSNIDIANNMLKVESRDSTVYGIYIYPKNGQIDDIYILNNEIDVSGENEAIGIFLSGVTASKIESNVIYSKSTSWVFKIAPVIKITMCEISIYALKIV